MTYDDPIRDSLKQRLAVGSITSVVEDPKELR
jgi:hypothetical protein